MSNPKISIIIPTSDMKNGEFFLARCLGSIKNQTYQNYEIITPKEGKVAHNLNVGIKQATGDIIKILCMDDYLWHPQALQILVDSWPFKWSVSGCVHDNGQEVYGRHAPGWNDKLYMGYNTIGGLSVLTFENNEPLLYTEGLDWTLDVDMYTRLYQRYGLPAFLMDATVCIGIGEHQLTSTLNDQQKKYEEELMLQKYGK